jgi:membrane-bound ClpP family serine protease
MCRKNQLIGVALAAFGLGLLVASFFESPFFCGCIGLIALAAGVVILQKK